MNTKKSLFALFLLVFSSLACTIFVGGPEYPETKIPVSTEAAGSVKTQVEEALKKAATNGQMILVLNESQVTSLLAYKLQENPEPLLTDPQVLLRNGEIQVFGKATQGNLQANVRIVLVAGVDADGKPTITVKSTDFGPIEAPEELNSTITSMVNEAFTGALGPAAIGFRLEGIAIADGMIAFSGRVK